MITDCGLADGLSQSPVQVQASSANADDQILAGQYAAAVNASTGAASFTGLLLHAPPGNYTVTFQAVGYTVSPARKAVQAGLCQQCCDAPHAKGLLTYAWDMLQKPWHH